MKSVSKNYIATLTVDNVPLALVGLHFLARPNDESRRLDREAQADAIRQIGAELVAQGRRLIVLGDFNDYDGETASRDHLDSLPISNVLKMVREMTPTDPADDLVNGNRVVPKAQRFTSWFDRNENGQVNAPEELTAIDHILVSPELSARLVSADIPHQHNPAQVSDHFPVVARMNLCDGPGPIPSSSQVRIARLLPNPPGDETENEEASLKNTGGQATSLTGWTLRDRAGRTWKLDTLGTLSAGEEKTIRRNGQSMAMTNSGDTIDLVDPAGQVIQSVTYTRMDEGEVMTPAD